MSDAVRYIHTQVQAQIEIERMRAINRANYAHRKQSMREDPEYNARPRAAQSEAQKTFHNKKRTTIEDDSLHDDIRKNANRMTRVRRMARETQNILDTQERENMIEKLRQRYMYFI